MSGTKAIWKFHWDFGRMGDVSGVFVATDEAVKNAIGKRVAFGEILGKHSDVYGTLDEGDLTRVSDNPEAVRVVEEFRLSSGYNPLDYLSEG